MSGPFPPESFPEHIIGSDAAVAVGRFQPDGPEGFRSKLGGPLRATRAEAEDDYRVQVDSPKVKLTYKSREDGYRGETDVFADGVLVARYRKRSEWYGNLGHRGVRYVYFDVYDLDGVKQGSDTTRKRALSEALAKMGLDAAALAADDGHARFHINKRKEQ